LKGEEKGAAIIENYIGQHVVSFFDECTRRDISIKLPGLAFKNSSFRPQSDVYVFCMDLRTKSDYFPLEKCFSAFVRPQPVKFIFHKTRAQSQQIYLQIPLHFF